MSIILTVTEIIIGIMASALVIGTFGIGMYSVITSMRDKIVSKRRARKIVDDIANKK